MADVKAARLEVDVADTQADEFRPPQARECQNCHDVALVSARRCQGRDFRGGEIAVAFPRWYAAR
ncbi:MAG: hypothetical protein EKK34_25165 [Mycobacterium sp.]|nr:MAG: hypothetical protein EKK34_25165 [Mycobacterium sp.]